VIDDPPRVRIAETLGPAVGRLISIMSRRWISRFPLRSPRNILT
jgi:hypothetical protein